MIRKFAIVLLILSFGLLARESTTVWQEEISPPLPAPAPEKAASPIKAPVSKTMLNPKVATQLPDLRKGYLFNEQRNLAVADEQTQQDEAEDSTLDDVTYNGSIISNEIRKGMISYPEKTEQTQVGNLRRRVARAPVKVEQIYEMLSTGDHFRGFEVLEILPEKIVFGKNDKKTEKFLYDLKKIRLQPPPLPTAAAKKRQDKSEEKDEDNAAASRRRQLELEREAKEELRLEREAKEELQRLQEEANQTGSRQQARQRRVPVEQKDRGDEEPAAEQAPIEGKDPDAVQEPAEEQTPEADQEPTEE